MSTKIDPINPTIGHLIKTLGGTVPFAAEYTGYNENVITTPIVPFDSKLETAADAEVGNDEYDGEYDDELDSQSSEDDDDDSDDNDKIDNDPSPSSVPWTLGRIRSVVGLACLASAHLMIL
jgi:hypothetical protein